MGNRGKADVPHGKLGETGAGKGKQRGGRKKERAARAAVWLARMGRRCRVTCQSLSAGTAEGGWKTPGRALALQGV